MKIEGATALVPNERGLTVLMAALIVLLVIAFVVLFMLSRGIRIVPQARAGIVERLGRYQPHAGRRAWRSSSPSSTA